MTVLPNVLWSNGARGWIVFALAFPFYLLGFALIVLLWLPYFALNLIFRLATCQGFSLGRDVFNPMFPVTNVVFSWLFTRNLLSPRGIVANIGKWHACVLGLLAKLIGKVQDWRRKAKAKKEGCSGDIPQPDAYVEEKALSASVTIVVAGFRETIDIPSQMTVIRHAGNVVFHNPVFAPKETYQRLGEGARRVILFLPTGFHHMAADICLASFPSVEIWGSPMAGSRHSPALAVKDSKDGVDFEGFRTASFQGTIYDERWLLFEPEGLLCIGDFMPEGLEVLDVPHWWHDLGTRCSSCGDCRFAMVAYQRTFVTNHDEVRAELERVMSWSFRHYAGCHPRELQLEAREELMGYWSWLLSARRPSGGQRRQNARSFCGSFSSASTPCAEKISRPGNPVADAAYHRL